MKLAIVSHKECWQAGDNDSPWLTDGGFPLQVRTLASLFDETVLLLPGKNHPPESGTRLEGDRLRVVALSPVAGKGGMRKALMPLWVLRNALAAVRNLRQADCVHVPIPSDVGTIGMLASLVLGKRLFVRHCGDWSKPRTLAERFWSWFMQRFASAQRPMWVTGDPSMPPPRSNRHIHSIFSTSLTSRQMQEVASPRSLDRNSVVLLTVGRLEARKGIDLAIQATSKLIEEYPGMTLHVVGAGGLREELSAMAADLGLEPQIVFHGQQSHAEVLHRLKQATLFLFPSTSSEGFPKAPLEALATGLPVVSTSISYLAHIEQEGCGIVTSGPTSEDLAAGIRRALSDPEAYDEMSEHAVRYARRFTLDTWQEKIRTRLRECWGPLRDRPYGSTH